MSNIINIGGGAGGSGSNVVPNPQGTATDTLTKIGIDGTIYGFAGSGGGSSYYEEVLWNNTSGVEFYPQSPQTITLANGIDNFDCLVFEYSNNASRDYRTETTIPVSMIDKTGNNYFSVVCMGSNTEDCPSVKYVDNTNLVFWGYSSSRHLFVYKIIGIKYGSSNSHNYSTTEQIVGTWIDGSTIYEKTISLQSVYLENNAVTPINVSTYVPNIAHGISLEGSLIYQSAFITMPFYQGQYVISACFDSNTTIGIYRSGGSITVDNLYLTIRYTKSST